MTKYYTVFLVLLFNFNLLAQEKESAIVAIAADDENNADLYDASAIGDGAIDVEELAEILTASAETEAEKAEAIFHWVTHNISYNLKMYDDFKTGERDKKKGKRIKRSERAEHNANKVKRTLKKRNGICEDYALLFTSLCDAAELESKVVKGYIRIDPEKLRSSGEKHVWNLVKIDGDWKAIDATYAAGHLDEFNYFVFNYDENYLFANKEAFSLNHLPKDTSAVLMDTIMTRNQFKTLPIIGRGFFNLDISNYEPLEVLQKVTQGEEFIITFTSPKKIGQFTVYKEKADKYEVVKRIKEGDDYTVVINTKGLKTGRLMLFGDQQLIASYRLTVKR